MLNTREIKIIQAIALGKSDKQIAKYLFASERSIRREILIAKCKLNAENRANLIYLACKKGIL